MKKVLLILLSLTLSLTLSAKVEKEHNWLTYSMEVKTTGVSQEELYDWCRYISGTSWDPVFSSCNWDDENKIKCYNYNNAYFEYGKNKYRLNYKVFISCCDEKYIISLCFIKAYILHYWGGESRVFKYDYLTENKEGVRGGIAGATYRFHDDNVRKMLSDYFKTICTNIKADMIIRHRR